MKKNKYNNGSTQYRQSGTDVFNNVTKGFTILELLMTIAIAGILIGIATPSFTTLIANTRVENRANDLFAALKSTRQNALMRNKWSFLCRTGLAVNNGGNLVCRNAPGDGGANLANNDWAAELISYVETDTTVFPSSNPSAYHAQYRIQTIEPTAANRELSAQNIIEAPNSNITITASANERIVIFNSSGEMRNTAPFRLAICDDRDDPELYGRIIEINKSGQMRLYKTDPSGSNTDQDCSPTRQ